MPFWEYRRSQDDREQRAASFSTRMRRRAFDRVTRTNLQSRGIDPDTVPSLNQDLDMETMTRKEAGARAQSLGVSVKDYRESSPKGRRAAASAVGHQYARQQELHEEGYSNEQIDTWDRVNRRALELIPEGIEAPHLDKRGRTVKGVSWDEELQKAQERAIGELGWNEAKALSPGGGILESFGRLIGQIEMLDPMLAGPLARTTEGFPVPDPEGRTQFERGADISRPVAEAILPAGLEDTIVEDILTEVINPAALVLIAPLAGQGIRAGMSARMVAAKMVSNLLGTGMEPELVQGTLRGLSKGGKAAQAAARRIPRGGAAGAALRLDSRGVRVPLSLPESGSVRLYRGEGGFSRTGERLQGRWFTPDANKASLYSSKGQVTFVDVPREVAEAGQVEMSAGKRTKVFAESGLREEILLPEDWARKALDAPPGTGTIGELEGLGGFTQRARTRTLRGGPPSPTIQEFQRHTNDMTKAVDNAKARADYIKVEHAAGRMDDEAAKWAGSGASERLSDARADLRRARSDLATATYKNAREEVVQAVKASGASDDVVRMIGDAFDHSVARVPGEEVLMNAGATRHFLATAAGHITGTPPGVVGRLAHHRDILLSGLRRYSVEKVHPVLKDVQKGLKSELDNIRFTGPKKWSELAEGEYKAHHIIQHPEWFEGISPTLRANMDEAQKLMRTRLETAKALGYPIEALDAAYLEQLWEIPSKAVGSHYLPGRVSVAKPKLFDDYFMGLAQGYTPQPMSVEELMQHSTGLLDQAVSDAWMKQEVVRRFGTKHRGKAIAGRVKFEHALYKAEGWSGPQEVVSWLDEMEAPVGRRLRQVSNVSAAFRGTVFGLTDIAVAGVQFPLAMAHGGMQVGIGTLNRSLQQLGSPYYFHLYAQDEAFLGRCVQAADVGLHIGTGPSSVRLGGGTVAKYIPGLKQAVEPAVSKAVDIATEAQFGHALTAVRLRMFEGNLIALKMSGKNIFDRPVRQLAAEWANSASGASRGPMIKGRRAVESVALTSVQMTRANLSVYGQLAKTVAGAATGRTSRMEVLRSAMTLANLGAYTYGIQYLFNEMFGDGPQEWVPGRPDWATIRIGGRTVPIIPQRSILRAIDKSVKILSEEVGLTDTDRYSPSDILMAWSQVAVGKASPLAGIIPGAAGFGFEPGTGQFHMGGLSAEGRLVGALPIPPLVEQAGWQERDELSLAIAGLGFNPYDTSSGTLLREEFANKFNGEELNWESPAHRELIEGNSRLDNLWEKSRAESREYGSEAAITSEEVRQEIADREKDGPIVRMAEAVLSGDPFATTNWAEARSEFLTWRSGKWDGKLTGREPRTEIGKLVNKFYAIDPKSVEFTDDSGITNWGKFQEAREAVLGQMPLADANAIRNNEKFTNPKAEKVDKQFRDAQDKLRPFWDLEDEVWGKLRKAHDVLRPYASLDEFKKAKVEELEKQGVPQEELQWRLSRVPAIAEVERVIGQQRISFRMQNPEVDTLLVKWYGNTPVREHKGVAGKAPPPGAITRPGRITRPSGITR